MDLEAILVATIHKVFRTVEPDGIAKLPFVKRRVAEEKSVILEAGDVFRVLAPSLVEQSDADGRVDVDRGAHPCQRQAENADTDE